MKGKFVLSYNDIVDKIEQVDPLKYGQTRNYTDGAVTYLSPYISRGVISTRQVFQFIMQKGFQIAHIQSFVKELCWRDYYQRLGQVKDPDQDIRQKQLHVSHHQLPTAVLKANCGINGIDNAIEQLYSTGYMHNHCRMYTASLVCNTAKSHWRLPAHWMYYHLLDGDWTSNACSWQWVAGANSNKKYYVTQDNINRYTITHQTDTFLDKDYPALETMEIPAELSATQYFFPVTVLPASTDIVVQPDKPTFIYNYYNLDPLWRKGESGNRILLLEPNFFERYPVSKQCIDFMMGLCANIKGIQIYTGSFASMVAKYNISLIYFKEHPFNRHYSGIIDERDWIVEEVTGYYPSFFSYWKNVEKFLIGKFR